MSLIDRLRRRPSRRDICLALAILLPPVSAFLSIHVVVLHRVPFGLFVISTVLIAALGGMLPALISAGFAILLSVIFPIPAHHGPIGYFATNLPRDLVLLVAAILVSIISDSRRRYEDELHLALAELQERSNDLVASLNSSKCASWTLDMTSGRSARWFSGSYQVFGRPFSEIEAMTSLAQLLHPDDRPRLVEVAQQMRSSDEPIVFEYRSPWPNGETHWLEMRANRVAGPGCHWRGVTVDITERKLTEAALLRSEKLAAMGRLASTVAHEINNPLEAVTNLLYLARAVEPLHEDTADYLAEAERELARLSNITRLTLGFVRTTGHVADTDVAEVVEEVLNLFHHRLETKNVHIERQYEPGVAVRIAPHELRQIATNLVANATDAVGLSDGRISIRIHHEDGQAGAHGVLLVEDNGSGIDADHLSRIFEPFFSTKEELGTGIGLWVTKELVERNGGRILVASDRPAGNRIGIDSAAREGAGHINGVAHGGSSNGHLTTRFRIELPLVPVASDSRTFDES
jgi:PAS domain S-box-containing protein